MPPEAVGWAASSLAAAHVLVDGSLDEHLTVTGDDGHHLDRVRRLRVGELVTAADGAGRWREYRVAEATRGSLTLDAVGGMQIEPTLTPSLAVAFSLTKGEKPETVVARLTELGVDRIIPVAAARSVVRWDESKAEAASARFERVAREAAMQSRRARLPIVDPTVPIASLMGRPGLVVATRDGQWASELPDPGPEGWLLVVGPEGGLDESELEALGGAPQVGVGPHVLRAETAAVAAAAALTTRRSATRGHGG